MVIPPSGEAECGVCSNEGPAKLVSDLAYQKVLEVRAQLAGRWEQEPLVLVTADTVAECDGWILGKPTDEVHARQTLSRLRGREHRVYTGLCVWPSERATGGSGSSQPNVRVAETTLVMDHLTDAQLESYLAGGQWRGKAGAFGYQHELGWVHVTHGSESNVVGLPMELMAEMLDAIGFPIPPK